MKVQWKGLLVLMSLLLAQDCIAQRAGARVNVDERVERMTEELELSDAQAGQIREILKQAQASRPNVRIMDRDEARPVMCKHLLATDASIQAVLTEAQAEEYAELKESRKVSATVRGRGPVDCSEFEASEPEED